MTDVRLNDALDSTMKIIGNPDGNIFLIINSGNDGEADYLMLDVSAAQKMIEALKQAIVDASPE